MQGEAAASSNLLALPDGTELVGDYRIKRVLGTGGFGITYLADEKALARLVTIKEYFPADLAARRQTSASPRSQEVAGDYRWGLDRFVEEAQTLARFDHPNIVRVHRYFRANNTAYMVLHFEEGGSFKSWLKGLRRAPRQTELDAMAAPLLDALEMIHKADYLHRDIAPDNIIVRRDGSPVLIDFGSARGEIAAQSRTVSALVKPGYSPYEQYATTSSNQGPWTDIYALGATLYHAVTGKRPPDAPSRVVGDEYVPARQAALGAYRIGFLHAIDKALKIETSERPQSIAEWRALLLAPDPKRERERAGLRLPIARKLGQLRAGATVGLSAAPAARPGAVGDLTVTPADTPPTLVPVPPDAPQPKGQLLDFIDALKKRAAPALSSRRRVAKEPRAAADALAGAPAQALAEPAFGLGYGPAPHTPMQPQKAAPAAKRAAKAAARGADAAPPARRPPKPRGTWRLPSRRWRSVIFKVAVAVAIASLAVAYRESAPRTEARSTGMVTGEPAETAQSLQLIGHQAPVVGVASADQGRWIVSAGADATLRVWSASSGALVRTIELDAGAATALAVDARRAATGHNGGRIVLWDLERAEKLAIFKLGGGPIASVAFTGGADGLVAATHDGGVALFEIQNPSAPALTFEGNGSGTGMVAAARSRRLVVVGETKGTVRLFRTDGGSLARTYRSSAGDITALVISDDGRYIAGAGRNGSVQIWTGSSSRPRDVLRAHDSHIAAMAFGPARLLATAADDGRIEVWNVGRGHLIRTLHVNAKEVRPMSFSPDGRFLFGAGQTGAIHVWSLGLPPSAGAS